MHFAFSDVCQICAVMMHSGTIEIAWIDHLTGRILLSR